MPDLRVHLSPAMVAPQEFRGGTAVVIDLIRASTTIVWALGNGAARVKPTETVDEALCCRSEYHGCLLGGERGGVLIENFDLGNSPTEYASDRIAGKTIIFTTTNGTRALKHATRSERLLVGAFANFSATVAAALEDLRRGRTVHILCAGIHDRVCLEDTLCAGAMAQAIHSAAPSSVPDDSARVAIATWRQHSTSHTALLEALHASEGGRNLRHVRLDRDIETVARRDAFSLVAAVSHSGWITGVPAQPGLG